MNKQAQLSPSAKTILYDLFFLKLVEILEDLVTSAKTVLTSCIHINPGVVTLVMSAEKAQKILSPVPYEQGFHFFMTDGHYSGETATSLCIFLKDLGRIDIQSIRFHLERGDFQKWLRATIDDEELAHRIDKIDKTAPDEPLIEQLTETVQKRISELQFIDT